MIGEWLAIPIIHAAGGELPGDPAFEQYQYPVAHRLLQRCDAVLRVAGESKGADADVEFAVQLGLPVYHDVRELPVPAAMSVQDRA